MSKIKIKKLLEFSLKLEFLFRFIIISINLKALKFCVYQIATRMQI